MLLTLRQNTQNCQKVDAQKFGRTGSIKKRILQEKRFSLKFLELFSTFDYEPTNDSGSRTTIDYRLSKNLTTIDYEPESGEKAQKISRKNLENRKIREIFGRFCRKWKPGCVSGSGRLVSW